jgi:hypothetical protein
VNQNELLKFVVSLLDELGVRYMVVGSYASGAYGEPRFTQDIDIVVDLSARQLDRLIARLPQDDFYVSHDAALAAIDSAGQFNVIHPESGNKIDFLIGKMDAWGRKQLSRRKRFDLLDGVTAYTAAPEDVILGKMLYYREGGSEKHLRDITGMLRISGNAIDRIYIAEWAQKLDVLDIWQAILKRLGL